MSRELFLGIYEVLVFWGAIVGVLSVILHARVDWRSSEMGRHLMFYMGIIAAVLTFTSLRLLFGWNSPWVGFVYVTVFAFVPLAMTQRLWLQWKAQHPKAPDTPPEGLPRIEHLR